MDGGLIPQRVDQRQVKAMQNLMHRRTAFHLLGALLDDGCYFRWCNLIRSIQTGFDGLPKAENVRFARIVIPPEQNLGCHKTLRAMQRVS